MNWSQNGWYILHWELEEEVADKMTRTYWKKKSTFGLLDYLRSAFLSKSEDSLSLISRITLDMTVTPLYPYRLLPYMIQQAISIGSL